VQGFDAGDVPDLVFDSSFNCAVKKFVFNGELLVHATSDSSGNSIEGNELEDANILFEGNSNKLYNNDFTGAATLSFYGAYANASNNVFHALNGFLVTGGHAYIAGNVEEDAVFGGSESISIRVKGQNALLEDNVFLGKAFFHGPPLFAQDFTATVTKTTAFEVVLDNAARVQWVSGETGETTFNDAASRLRRGWLATLQFVKDGSIQPIELTKDLVITDAKGNQYVCAAGSTTCTINDGTLFEAVYSRELVGGLQRGKLVFAGEWDAGSYNPYSYDPGDGTEETFDVTGDGVIPVKLLFGAETPSPQAEPGKNPAGVYMKFTSPTRAQIAGDVEVRIWTQYNGENNCELAIQLTVEGPQDVVMENLAGECKNGVHSFTLKNLLEPGNYDLHAVAVNWPEPGDVSQARTTFQLIGRAPVATPELSLALVVLAAGAALYAWKRKGRRT